MSAASHKGPPVPLMDCWNIIGVRGDHSCPKLVTVVHCHNCQVFAEAAQAFLDRPAPEGYIDEVTSLLAESEPAEKTSHSLSVVVFEIEGQALAIDTRAVVEVTEAREVHRMVHRSGRVFSGIVNIHGQLELCASLSGLLQIGADGTQNEKRPASALRMVVVDHAEQRWVFSVDRSHGVKRFSPDDVLDVPATAAHDMGSYIKSILRWDERDVGYLDLDKTFNALGLTLR